MNKKTTFLVILGLTFLSLKNTLYAQVNDLQLYGFIHSLVVHEPPLIPVPNNETTTPYWVNDIAQFATNSFGFTGQFGQIPDHVDQLPPDANIGFPSVASPWDSDSGQTFATSDINAILLTAANFIQWVLPTDPDPADAMGRTIVANTETLFDWTDNEISGLRYYIYGNWPEMNTASAFPPTIPTQSEIDEFHNITMGITGDFDDWWLQYQDAIVTSRPALNVKLIPVGRIISLIHTQIIPNQIPFDELYEDSDPHGRANTYFLAGLITYTALYEQQVPGNYMPSAIISPEIRNNLTAINDFIWQELNNFNFPNGDSRVFYSSALNIKNYDNVALQTIFPNPVDQFFSIKLPTNNNYTISIFNSNGSLVKNLYNIKNSDNIHVEDLTSGVYFIKIQGNRNDHKIKKMIKK